MRELEQRVLFVPPTPRDGEITRSMLARVRLACALCADLPEGGFSGHSLFVHPCRPCHPWLDFPSENAGRNKPRITPITRMTSG
jgi:hypothetical protein